MGFLSIFFIIIAFACAFISGTLFGYDLRATYVKQTLVASCDSCNNEIVDDEIVLCEDCQSEDKLNSAISEKEMSIRYALATLKQRNLINRPDKAELEKHSVETNRTRVLCEKLREVAADLKLDLQITELYNSNEQLRQCVNKWKELDEREEAINKVIEKNTEEDVVVDMF